MHTISLKSLPGRSRAPLRPSRTSHRRRVGDSVKMVLNGIIVWQERARQRHMLAALEPRLLADMGLTRADVVAECGKPFWRA